MNFALHVLSRLRQFRNEKETGAEIVPRLFLGLLLGTHGAVIKEL